MWKPMGDVSPGYLTDGFEFVRNSGLPEVGWSPIAFSDITRAHRPEILYLSQQNDTVRVFSANNKQTLFKLRQEIAFPGRKIENVMPCDFRYTGYNDLVLVMQTDDGYDIGLLENNKGVISSEIRSVFKRAKAKPFILDVFGDNRVNLIVSPADDDAMKRVSYSPIDDSISVSTLACPNVYESFEKIRYGSDKRQRVIGKHKMMPTLHVLDIGASKCNKIAEIDIPEESGDPLVADLNDDGFFDLIVPVYPKEEVPYLCFLFGSKDGIVGTLDCSNFSIYSRVTVENMMKDPRYFQIGDVSLRGGPDLAIPVYDDSGRASMAVLINTFDSNSSSHAFTLNRHSIVPGIGGFYDIGNDGHLGLLTSRGLYKTNMSNGFSFIRVSVLNAHCLDQCSDGQKYPYPAPLSTIDFDSWVEVTYTDKSGETKHKVGSHGSSSRLSSPFWLVGLSQDVHYIQEMKVHSVTTEEYFWILPNSLVFTAKHSKIRVFLMYPLDSFYIFFGCLTLLFVLGFFVLQNAKKEDDEDKQEAAEILPLF